MRHLSRFSTLTVASAVMTLLAACSGGGETSAGSVSAQSLSGTVAVGAPMLNATITVKDANGVTKTAQAAADGSYSGLDVSGLTAPFRVQACGLVDGSYTCYYSVVQGSGTANVTPLTNATVALALNGDAADLFSGSSAPSRVTLDAKKAALQAALGPVLTAAGLSATTDFETTHFDANRTGMDKVLDAVKISSGSNAGHAFVQVEGRIGSGNLYLDSTGSSSGGLGSGSVATNMSVDLTSITSVFAAMSQAIGQASAGSCTTSMAGSGIFDSSFSLDIGTGPLTASTAPATICGFASTESLLGGGVANPVLRDCDFSGSDKICVVGFDLHKDDVVFEGAELAVVLRNGSSAWKLLGQESPYEIHVGAAAQRTTRANVSNPTPSYTRALSFDIKSDVGGVANSIRAAKVYQHDSGGTGWDSTPLVVLDDSGCSSETHLTIQGSSCGSTWLSIDSYSSGSLADGDAMIDAFYRRGRQVKIELYSDTAATALVTTVIKRVDGVPPKAADLPNLPWLELDSATKAALSSYDSSTSPSSFTATWAENHVVAAKDISVCASGSCSPRVHEDVSSARSGASSKVLDLSSLTLTASGFKEISLYGRNREQVGISTNFVSCQTGSMGCPAP